MSSVELRNEGTQANELSAATTLINRPVHMGGSITIDRALKMEDLRHKHLSSRGNGFTDPDLAPAILPPNATESNQKRPSVETKPRTKLEPPGPEKVTKNPILIEPAVGIPDQNCSLEPSARAAGYLKNNGISADGVRLIPQVRRVIPSSGRMQGSGRGLGFNAGWDEYPLPWVETSHSSRLTSKGVPKNLVQPNPCYRMVRIP